MEAMRRAAAPVLARRGRPGRAGRVLPSGRQRGAAQRAPGMSEAVAWARLPGVSASWHVGSVLGLATVGPAVAGLTPAAALVSEISRESLLKSDWSLSELLSNPLALFELALAVTIVGFAGGAAVVSLSPVVGEARAQWRYNRLVRSGDTAGAARFAGRRAIQQGPGDRRSIAWALRRAVHPASRIEVLWSTAARLCEDGASTAREHAAAVAAWDDVARQYIEAATPVDASIFEGITDPDLPPPLAAVYAERLLQAASKPNATITEVMARLNQLIPLARRELEAGREPERGIRTLATAAGLLRKRVSSDVLADARGILGTIKSIIDIVAASGMPVPDELVELMGLRAGDVLRVRASLPPLQLLPDGSYREPRLRQKERAWASQLADHLEGIALAAACIDYLPVEEREGVQAQLAQDRVDAMKRVHGMARSLGATIEERGAFVVAQYAALTAPHDRELFVEAVLTPLLEEAVAEITTPPDGPPTPQDGNRWMRALSTGLTATPRPGVTADPFRIAWDRVTESLAVTLNEKPIRLLQWALRMADVSEEASLARVFSAAVQAQLATAVGTVAQTVAEQLADPSTAASDARFYRPVALLAEYYSVTGDRVALETLLQRVDGVVQPLIVSDTRTAQLLADSNDIVALEWRAEARWATRVTKSEIWFVRGDPVTAWYALEDLTEKGPDADPKSWSSDGARRLLARAAALAKEQSEASAVGSGERRVWGQRWYQAEFRRHRAALAQLARAQAEQSSIESALEAARMTAVVLAESLEAFGAGEEAVDVLRDMQRRVALVCPESPDALEVLGRARDRLVDFEPVHRSLNLASQIEDDFGNPV